MGRKNSKKPGKKRERNFDEYKGVIEITRSGMGFVVVEGLETDILVRPNDFNTAMHGDTVRVQVNPDRSGKRMQGVITDVIERKQLEFVGRLQMNKGFAFFVAEGDKKMPDIFISQSDFNGAQDNDRVVVRIKEWEKDSKKRPVGEVVNVLNAEDLNDVAMKEILLENGFPLQFSDEALEEAARIPDTISEEEIKKRRDFRGILTFTIDPLDAKDFDDA